MGEQVTGIHHVAFATRDSKATYEFYHEKLGCPLVHTEAHKHQQGYFRHFFFDMGNGQLLGFFEIHDIGEKPDFKTDLWSSNGVPPWVNHLAFDLGNEENYQAFKSRVKENGLKIMGEQDHTWCKSIYLTDPNGLLVEFSLTHKPELFNQTGEQAYDLLFNVPAEELTEESRKE